jgi:DmsE family decaheme c-type cytochrome
MMGAREKSLEGSMSVRVFFPGVAVALLFSLSAVAQTAVPAHTASFDITECQTCHADQFTNFSRTYHAKAANSCANCHGDVAAHAKAVQSGEGIGPIISFKKLAPKEVNERCLTCHDKARQAKWHGGMHERRGLACTTCHSIHSFKSERSQLKTARESETCFGCHANVRAQSLRASHHPLREGKMDCGSCHDPHDATTPRMLRAQTVNELCYTCHTEKRGPFLWEHAPVRENCANCHQPHGSNHDKLMVASLPFLCQRCHSVTRHPGTLYDLNSTLAGPNPSNRAVEHACRNCHQSIHGSNAPSGNFLSR